MDYPHPSSSWCQETIQVNKSNIFQINLFMITGGNKLVKINFLSILYKKSMGSLFTMGAFLKGAFSKGANLKGAFLKGANLKGAFLQHNR